MSEPSDRDILIAVRTTVEAIHRDMVEPGGRVPRLEGKVEEHSTQISSAAGGVKVIVWAMGILALLLVTLAGVVLAHVLGTKP